MIPAGRAGRALETRPPDHGAVSRRPRLAGTPRAQGIRRGHAGCKTTARTRSHEETMPRVYLPLIPLPVLAAVVAFSACGTRSEPTPHLIPQAAALAPAPPVAPPATPAAQPPTGDSAPSDEELRAFERPVAK